MSSDSGLDQPSAQFLLRLKQREEKAFNELVIAHEQKVYRLVWRMLANQQEAEDLTQEVFVQVFKSIDTFRGDSKLSTWIYRIALNLTRNRTKYLSRRKQTSHSDIFADEGSLSHHDAQGITIGETSRPDLVAMGNEAERIVHECLSILESEFREILVLRDVECLSYEEVGAITGLAAGTVKSRLHRARSLLKHEVELRLGGSIE